MTLRDFKGGTSGKKTTLQLAIKTKSRICSTVVLNGGQVGDFPNPGQFKGLRAI